ncbi:MAG: pro-sigmaK processing inhibitor BofA family protein [Oscillospiraceae bacterium]|nr:pro-sigmaK processing inhibitor BofA family protein [Oscillospiraceae bacterium]
MKEYFFIGIWIAAGIIMLKFYAKRKNTVISAFAGMISGGIALVAVHYLGSYIGITIPVNLFNTAVSLILGIPGAVFITAVNIFL